jgi:CspA family cold shock protein
MLSGTVKWYESSTGYGFIRPDSGGEDVLVHASSIANNKIRKLFKNQHVVFEIKNDPNVGPLAINVQCLSLR